MEMDIKAQKVIYQYHGQEYLYKNEFGTYQGVVGDYHTQRNLNNDWFKLRLKPISAITDEDAIEVAKILKPNDEHTHNSEYGKMYIKNLFDGVLYTIDKSIKLYQFLISRGYDFQNYLLDGKTLQEAGLAIYEKTILPKTQQHENK